MKLKRNGYIVLGIVLAVAAVLVLNPQLREHLAADERVYQATERTTDLRADAPSGMEFTDVLFASYGVPYIGKDGEPVKTWCHAASSEEKVRIACLNKSSCSVPANNDLFGDPCPGPQKRLIVKLKFGPKAIEQGVERAFTADEGRTMAIDVSPKVITDVLFASWGDATGSVNTSFDYGSCHAQSSRQKVEEACLNKSRCEILADNSVFGEPCSGKRKYLAVRVKTGDAPASGSGSNQTPTTPEPTPTPTEEKKDEGLSGGAIAAIVIGVLVLLIIIGLAISSMSGSSAPQQGYGRSIKSVWSSLRRMVQ